MIVHRTGAEVIIQIRHRLRSGGPGDCAAREPARPPSARAQAAPRGAGPSTPAAARLREGGGWVPALPRLLVAGLLDHVGVVVLLQAAHDGGRAPPPPGAATNSAPRRSRRTSVSGERLPSCRRAVLGGRKPALRKRGRAQRQLAPLVAAQLRGATRPPRRRPPVTSAITVNITGAAGSRRAAPFPSPFAHI